MKGKSSSEAVLLDASDRDEMHALVLAFDGATRIAVDTESDAFHRYFEKVCLIQLASADVQVVLDPLPGGLAPELTSFLADPRRTLVMHGADYDVRSLRRGFDLVLGRIFDTSLAAMLLGEKQLGLKALLEKELGVSIEKGEQRSDWARRPLRPEQLAYAAADVAHLLPLAEKLEARLDALGRRAWLEEDCNALRFKVASERVFDLKSWRKLEGVRGLAPLGQRVARALHLWRESEARRRDLPPFRVMPNALIVELARRIERGEDVCALVAADARCLPRHLDPRSVEDVIRGGMHSSDAIEPLGPAVGDGERPDKCSHDDIQERLERMRRARAARAELLGIDPGFLISGNVLKKLAREPPSSIEALKAYEGLSAWRAEVVGHELLAALDL